MVKSVAMKRQNLSPSNRSPVDNDTSSTVLSTRQGPVSYIQPLLHETSYVFIILFLFLAQLSSSEGLNKLVGVDIANMAAGIRQTPLTCPGHTRPVVHLHFSGINADGKFYFISASKGEITIGLASFRPKYTIIYICYWCELAGRSTQDTCTQIYYYLS